MGKQKRDVESRIRGERKKGEKTGKEREQRPNRDLKGEKKKKG